jgi:hypothetical protein
MFKTPEHEQSSNKDSIVKTPELIDEELAFWEMYLMKKVIGRLRGIQKGRFYI